MADGSGKHVYILEPANTATEPVPLHRILLLHPHASTIALREATEAQAVHAILAATFNPLHTEPVRLERLLRNAREIAACNCCFFLDVPRDLAQIDDVAGTVMAQAE